MFLQELSLVAITVDSNKFRYFVDHSKKNFLLQFEVVGKTITELCLTMQQIVII